MLTVQNLPEQTLELPGSHPDPCPKDGGTAKFDLELQVADGTGGLAVLAEYDADLFDGTTVERLLAGFERLLEGAVREPGLRISELPLLGAPERHQIVVEWNDSARDVPAEEPFQRLFARRAALAPEAVAAACDGVHLTYRELDQRSSAVAARLAARGVRRGAVVALLLEPRPRPSLTAVLAVLKAGGAWLPLDPHQPRAAPRHRAGEQRGRS